MPIQPRHSPGNRRLTERDVQRILRSVPGARLAADGVIIDNGDGKTFHINGIVTHDSELTDLENLHLAYATKHEILRLRALRSAHDYFLRVRIEAIAASPRAIRLFRKRRAMFEERGRRWTLTDYYNAQNVDARRYVSRLSRPLQRIVKAIPYGLAPIDEVNAVARRTLLGDVVMASENLRYFFYFMNIAMHGDRANLWMGDRIDAAVIALRIMRGSESFDFDLDPRANLPPPAEREIQARTSRQVEFTFGHEFAHLLEGHLTESVDESDIRLYSHECEFTADRQAVLAAGFGTRTKTALGLGAFDVLLYLHFLERSAHVGLLPRRSGIQTHPSPLERIHRLKAGLKERFVPAPRDFEESIEAIEEMVELVAWRKESCGRPDLLGFYGSVYLPSFMEKMRTDRIDF